MIAISIIIPVYNAETFLAECIESLLEQTIISAEFIFVNDGSKDSSQILIESYQKNDSRIQLINQENQGVSVARNNGIAAAKGTYIGFLDADDYVENNFYEQLYSNATKYQCEVTVAGFVKEMDGKFYPYQSPFPQNAVFDAQFSKEKIIPFMLQNDTLNSCWNKLYQADFLKSNQINFPKNVALGEDGLFNFQAFFKANRILFIENSGYFYREVQGSASRNIVEKDYFKRALEVYNFDYEGYVKSNLEGLDVKKLKGIRLLEKVISYISIYLNANESGSFFSRYRYVKAMISNAVVQQNLHSFWEEVSHNKSKFEKFNLYCIRYRLMLPLVLATKYSYFRNKK